MKNIYIAGPMRGHPRYNFDAFLAAEEKLKAKGWNVLSPARMDLNLGFNPDTDTPSEAFMADARWRDVKAILREADAIYMLKDWEKSTRARAEKALAEWKEIDVLFENELNTPENILQEAMRLVCGDRQATYGPPNQDFERTAKMWSAIKGVEFTPSEVAQFMICIKLSRQTHQKKRDNWVDIAGYAYCGQRCDETPN